jgi:hypothetical protein
LKKSVDGNFALVSAEMASDRGLEKRAVLLRMLKALHVTVLVATVTTHCQRLGVKTQYKRIKTALDLVGKTADL